MSSKADAIPNWGWYVSCLPMSSTKTLDELGTQTKYDETTGYALPPTTSQLILLPWSVVPLFFELLTSTELKAILF